MKAYYRVRNWEKFQHYKDRNPPWIKLHRDLLTDYEFSCLQDASKLLLMMIWMLASQTDNQIPDDPKYLQNLLHLGKVPDLQALEQAGYIEYCYQDASGVLAIREQSAMPETETEAEAEAETEKPLSDPTKRNGKNLGAFTTRATNILEFLNEKFDRRWPSRNPKGKLTSNVTIIADRLKDGYSDDQCRQVAVVKWRQWKDDPEMTKHLQPSTLYRKSNFERYLGELHHA